MSGDPAVRSGSFESLPAEQPFPGVARRALTTEQLTLARYSFDPGASFPLHSHAQEQLTLVDEGSVEMTVGERTITLGPGEWSLVGPGIEHGITAGPEGARIVAIVSPARARADEYEVARPK